MKTKRLFAAAMAMVLSIGMCLAQNTVTHTVERGETLASIAQRFGTTEAKIIELNPDAQQFIYVGMELTLPQPTTQKTETVSAWQNRNTNKSVKHSESYNFNQTFDSDNNSSDFKHWEGSIFFDYDFLQKQQEYSEDKDHKYKGRSFAFTLSAGANYYITKSWFVGARIGFSSSTLSTLNKEYTYNESEETNNYGIYLPIETGLKLSFSKGFALIPYVGADLGYAVKSTKKHKTIGSNPVTNKTKNKIKKPFGINGRIGVRLYFGGIVLGGSYVFTFDKNFGKKVGAPVISLGFNF